MPPVSPSTPVLAKGGKCIQSVPLEEQYTSTISLSLQQGGIGRKRGEWKMNLSLMQVVFLSNGVIHQRIPTRLIKASTISLDMDIASDIADNECSWQNSGLHQSCPLRGTQGPLHVDYTWDRRSAKTYEVDSSTMSHSLAGARMW